MPGKSFPQMVADTLEKVFHDVINDSVPDPEKRIQLHGLVTPIFDLIRGLDTLADANKRMNDRVSDSYAGLSVAVADTLSTRKRIGELFEKAREANDTTSVLNLELLIMNTFIGLSNAEAKAKRELVSIISDHENFKATFHAGLKL